MLERIFGGEYGSDLEQRLEVEVMGLQGILEDASSREQSWQKAGVLYDACLTGACPVHHAWQHTTLHQQTPPMYVAKKRKKKKVVLRVHTSRLSLPHAWCT